MKMTEYEKEFLLHDWSDQNNFENYMENYKFRHYNRLELIRKYGFAIPSLACLKIIKAYSPILEVGAGNGYWAYELKKMGTDIIATDHRLNKDSSYESIRNGKSWIDIEKLDALTAINKYFNRTLMMIWPCLNKDWSYEAAKTYRGNKIIFVGEDVSGCTAGDKFWDFISDWDAENSIDILRFPGIYDYFRVYVKTNRGNLK